MSSSGCPGMRSDGVRLRRRPQAASAPEVRGSEAVPASMTLDVLLRQDNTELQIGLNYSTSARSAASSTTWLRNSHPGAIATNIESP